jgi:hypothetical protein
VHLPPAALVIFQIGAHIFAQGRPGATGPFLCLPCSWDGKCTSSHTAYWLR